MDPILTMFCAGVVVGACAVAIAVVAAVDYARRGQT